MTRLPDSKKVKRVDGFENKKGKPTALQPLPLNKSTRLPPLKSNRLPDIKPIQQTNRAPPLTSRPDLETRKPIKENDVFCRKGAKCEYTSRTVVSHQSRGNTEKVVNKNIHVIENIHKSNDVQKANSKDKLFTNEVAIKRNDNVCLEEIKRSSSRVDSRSKITPTTCPKIHHVVSKEVTWQKERDLLRKHRKQQAQRMNACRQPVKAITAYDKTGKESKMQCPKLEKSVRPPSERQKVDLSVRRKCDEEEDWDWDKDIEEIMEMEEKQKTRQHSTSGTCTPFQNGGLQQNGGRNPQAPVNLNCSKKGVGFKSKKRLNEEKQQELVRIEKERKEKEKIEMMIPQKIREDLKKYGFR